MKFKKSLALIIALLMITCTLLTGCNAANTDVDNSAASEDSVEGYAWWWSWFYPRTSQTSTQKATEKATQKATQKVTQSASTSSNAASLESVMEYTGKPYATVNNNQPEFKSSELTTKGYEFYSPLDALGRCGYVQACVGTETMPTAPRGNISSVKPTGWKNKTYDTKIVEGGSLYNRCHLIGFQLTGENANKQNLITGTRYMNADGMLPFENMIADYVKETGNHVMYRVTPIFEGKNLVASGVQMEAYSVEDNGKGVCFNIYVYNVQPGITINYATGENWLTTTSSSQSSTTQATETTYILNTGSKKIHLPTCSSSSTISEKNRKEYTGSINDLLSQGYTTCGGCKPK